VDISIGLWYAATAIDFLVNEFKYCMTRFGPKEEIMSHVNRRKRQVMARLAFKLDLIVQAKWQRASLGLTKSLNLASIWRQTGEALSLNCPLAFIKRTLFALIVCRHMP
jgi:hypothetical protein